MGRLVMSVMVALCLVGCDRGGDAPDHISIVSVGFRRGLSSDFVLKVGNLSSVQGVEAKVHVFNGEKAKDSAWFVIPSGAKKEIGMLEMGWGFAPGDRGCVSVASHSTAAYFAVLDDDSYGIVYSQRRYTDEELAAKDFSQAVRTLP